MALIFDDHHNRSLMLTCRFSHGQAECGAMGPFPIQVLPWFRYRWGQQIIGIAVLHGDGVK